ncbi:UNVERIFIED_CONTAM: Beta-1,2-xylosyltransferase [Sesamum angustifolium]|uniref:Beta-1,2-xylosyltransferase n=1 Tax=Sesamum angustifolium TaxID=2727405 RepID=A0AAW2KVF2_9LAMI
MNSKKLKILLSLFTLNSLSLYLYFSSHPDHHHSSPSKRSSLSEYSPPHHPLSVKPWPILPSYLPWSHNSETPFRSCEAYFGNGFTRRVDPLKPIAESRRSAGGGGWFRCFYSETLRSSICEGGRIRMVPERIAMSRGGEKLESVIGRGEDEELPNFNDGAFEIEVGGNRSRVGEKLVDEEFLDKYLEDGNIDRHTMRGLIGSIRTVDASEFVCSEWIEEPTLLVTRFEYANVFHTFTDWYSTYVASRVTGLPNRPHVVFVDGHCQKWIEVRAVRDLMGLSESIDCDGASAQELWQKPDTKKTARLSEFGEMIRAAFGFPVDRHHIPKPTSGHNILFVRREDYLAHPRHGGRVQTRLINEQEVFNSIKSWASNHTDCKLNVVNGLFAHMPMKEQVRAIQDAAVIIGAHGAGLTHIVSATPKTVILEIVSSEYRRPHFELIARWKGLEYHAIYLGGSYANPSVVINKLSAILRNLGC